MERVFAGKCNFLSVIEKPIYALIGKSATEDMNWKSYALSLVWFNLLGIIFLFLLLMLQGLLPLNPAHMSSLSWDLALNTAISFVSNTNWQNYGGESTMSYLSQMLGLGVQNFLSAATGIAVVIALIRGFASGETKSIGNFWQDTVKATLYILIPLSLILAVFFISRGVPQNFKPYQDVQLL